MIYAFTAFMRPTELGMVFANDGIIQVDLEIELLQHGDGWRAGKIVMVEPYASDMRNTAREVTLTGELLADVMSHISSTWSDQITTFWDCREEPDDERKTDAWKEAE
jgi:hypothetical protein